MIWHLNKIQYPIYNLGPGKRIGIWVQGCNIRCKGCINQSVWNTENGKKVHVMAIYEIVKHINIPYDGITITGGEPFDQYPQLMAFAMMIKRRTKLNILCYSGYYLNELEARYPDKGFYKFIDFLVDGRYDSAYPTINSMKGSGNQNIYTFVDGKALKTELDIPSKIWSVKCENEMVYMAGIPVKNEMETLFENLSGSGINAGLV